MIPISYNLRSLAVRRTTTVAAVIGIGLVVGVLAASLMLSNGIRETLGKSGSSDVAVVLRKGSDAELPSSIEAPALNLILAAPGVRRDKSGAGIGVGEVVAVLTMDKLGTDGVSNVQLRGVPDAALRFHKDVQIVAGRPAQPGTNEVVIGERLRGRFKGLDLDGSFELRKNRPVRVVGVFTAAGSSFESEVWTDLDTARAAFGRQGLFSSVRVQLESADKFAAFEAAVEGDKQLGLDAQREDRFYEKLSEGTSLLVLSLGLAITVIFSIGAMIGAMITMYASIASRRREIGTLRALGFSRFGILTSFLIESVCISLLGSVLGIGAALLVGMIKFSTLNFATFSEMVFSFHATPGILLTAVLFAAGLGIVGGFFPALQAARTSPIRAMRGG